MLDNHCIHCNEQIGDGDDQPLSSYDFVYTFIFLLKCFFNLCVCTAVLYWINIYQCINYVANVDTQQQVQCGVWVCEHDISGSNPQTLQGLPPSTLGGIQFQKNLRSYLRESSGIHYFHETYLHTRIILSIIYISIV